MSFKEYFSLIFSVLKDFRVIGTIAVMIIVIEFAKFVTTYKKKPPRPRKRKAPKSSPPQAPEEKKEENAESEEEDKNASKTS
jgi:hypothetical protein